jgi:hypothetical protein
MVLRLICTCNLYDASKNIFGITTISQDPLCALGKILWGSHNSETTEIMVVASIKNL